jgi:hypothetical protein
MFYYIIIGLYVFVFEKIKNKIYSRCVYNGVKLICYTKEWHKNDTLNDLLDWVFL